MKIRIAALCGLICIAASSGISRADDRSEIQALYYKVGRAMSSRDAVGVMACGTADMVYIERGKSLYGDQISRRMEQRFRLMRGSPRCRVRVLSLTVKGKSASALTSNFTEAEVSGSGVSVHRVIANSTSRDQLVKTKRGWLMKSVFVLSDTMTLDGKPINSSVLGGG